jgi:hypothetical protein
MSTDTENETKHIKINESVNSSINQSINHRSLDQNVDHEDELTDEEMEELAAANDRMKTEIEAQSRRRAIIQDLLQENERLKQERELHTPSRPRQQASTVERSLSFTPASSRPTPFIEGRPDYYAQSISQMQNLSHPHTTAAASGQIVKRFLVEIPKPEPFNGRGRAASGERQAESVQVRLTHFLTAVERYINYQCEVQGIVATPEQFCSSACAYLIEDASQVHEQLLVIAHQAEQATGVVKSVTWPDVRSALRVRYGKPLSGHQLILSMLKMQQSATDNVASFTTHFEEKLVELTRLKLDSRDLAAALYINGLTANVREKVEEKVNMTASYFEQANITTSESRAVVSHLQTMATALEASISSSARRTGQSNHSQNQRPNNTNNQNVSGTSSTKASDHTNSRGSEKIYRVPDALFHDRLSAGLCGRCGKEHDMSNCRAPRTLTPVPVTAATAKRSGRANVMYASVVDKSAATDKPATEAQVTSKNV